jgi:hypothetical protein
MSQKFPLTAVHMIVKQCAVERAYDSQQLNVLGVHTRNTMNEFRVPIRGRHVEASVMV